MPSIGSEMPSLEGATEWFNATGARAAAEAKGHPTLIHFWSASCATCKENMPHVAAWRDRFEGLLRVIAIHAPRSHADADTEQVRDAVSLNNIIEPCAVDNEHKLRAAFENEQDDLPAYYLYDGEGRLLSFGTGDDGLSTVGAALEPLLASHEGGGAAL